MADHNQNGRNESQGTTEEHGIIINIIAIVILLALIAGIGYGLWWVGNWIWDIIGAFFDWLFSGGGDGRLGKYCAGKYGSTTSALYRQCVDGGWKDWYANAHWMK